MPAEAGVGQVAERDRAIHPHVGQGPLGAVLETLPLLVARVIFPPVPVAHLLGLTRIERPVP